MSISVKVFGLSSFLIGATLIVTDSDFALPGNNQGYEPVQPIAFSHRLHAGELGIECLYCHYGAPKSRHAGIPPAAICMNCHAQVSAGFDAVLEERARAEAEGREPARIVSPKIAKLYEALALDEDAQPLAGAIPRPIEWVRVHNLADFVFFDHSVHVARGVACESCHGPVGSMERMRQESDLSMGWCLDCHRSNSRDPARAIEEGARQPADHVSTDCASCHI